MLSLEEVQVVQGGFRLSADFGVPPAAQVAVMGPSGAGKSTLLGAIAGFVPLSAGRVCWGGRDLARVAPGARPMSILFQDGNLFPHLSVAQNVGLGLRADLRLTAAEWASVGRLLGRVGLDGLGGRRAAELSGGQQGRVALARALLRARPLLLLDEPFAALGPALKAEMLALTAEVVAETGATLLMVTHDPLDARALAQSIVLVAEGRAEAPVAAATLLDTKPPALQACLGK